MKKDAAMQRSQKRRRGRETPKRRPLPAPACKHQVQLRKKVVGTLILFQRLRMEDALEPSCEDAEPATAPLTTQMVDAAPGNEFVDEPPNDRVQEMPIENSTGEAEAMDVALPPRLAALGEMHEVARAGGTSPSLAELHSAEAEASAISPTGHRASPAAGEDDEAAKMDAPLNDARIEVYWPDDDKWYGCVVAGFELQSLKHKLRYDDGIEETLDLLKEEWRPAPPIGSLIEVYVRAHPAAFRTRDDARDTHACAQHAHARMHAAHRRAYRTHARAACTCCMHSKLRSVVPSPRTPLPILSPTLSQWQDDDTWYSCDVVSFNR